ncbi:Armadillo-type fold [Phytophthora cactorum]|nr:Armadillo-type fold [Phytophthora cactorum]
MATEGGIDMLIDLLGSTNEHVQRQAAKALANLGVNVCLALCCLLRVLAVDNKERIAKAGGIKPLIDLASSHQIGVAVEAIAALANLAVNDANEVEIARKGGLKPIIDGAHSESVELQSQVARALRNLSVNRTGKQASDRGAGRVEALQSLVRSTNDRICQQATRALVNLGVK